MLKCCLFNSGTEKANTIVDIFCLNLPIALSVVPAEYKILNFYFEGALCTD